ncbi:MAG: hypothetical protein FJW39_01460 [Acidobacteria bacterium]|nr:hypothetical protein [Acidobacteriota bacterium]
MWRGLSVALAVAAVSWGQEGFGSLFTKAPKHIDDALRERVNFFYERQMAGKSRQADAAVHEDSKDLFFEAPKLQMRSFKIVSINYEENYQRAKVVIDMDTDFHFVGFGTMKVNRPAGSTWKFDQGQWWWFVENSSSKDSPWGLLSPGPGQAQADFNKYISSNEMTVDKLRSKVKVDKDKIELPSDRDAAAEVIITNDFDGPVTVSMQADDFGGVVINLEGSRIERGQTAKLTVTSRPVGPAKKPDLRVLLIVEPIGKHIPILVTFAYPQFNEPKPGTVVPVPGKK